MARMTHAEVESPEQVLESAPRAGIAFLPFFPLGIGALSEAGRPRSPPRPSATAPPPRRSRSRGSSPARR